MKFIGLSVNNFPACRNTPSPLLASVPTLSNPTDGLVIFSTAAEKAVPIIANCNNCSASQEILAPRSNTVVPTPLTFGSEDAMAGRYMPEIVFTMCLESAISAPVFPALTAPSESPFFTSSKQIQREESFPCFNAFAGAWSIFISNSVCLTVNRPPLGLHTSSTKLFPIFRRCL